VNRSQTVRVARCARFPGCDWQGSHPRTISVHTHPCSSRRLVALTVARRSERPAPFEMVHAAVILSPITTGFAHPEG
jgi:hypothetical protein